VLDGILKPLLEEFGSEGPVIRPYDSGFFHFSLVSARNRNGYFIVLLNLRGSVCQDECAHIADIFDGALINMTIDGKRNLPVADGSFNFTLVIHGGNYKPACLNSQE
jgi:hypothetical protein